jgi:acetyltransferase-like isoleucine patch superfamily enzyme
MRGTISSTARLYEPVELGEDVTIADYVIVGHPRERLVLSSHCERPLVTRLGDRAAVFPLAIIYDGAEIGADVVIEERCKIGYEAHIGAGSKVINGAIVHDQARIKRRCVIGGIVCERAVIGDNSHIMGAVLHSHGQPHMPWGVVEPSPEIGPRVVVAHGATVAGEVTVGHNVYIAVNAIVTRDVPPRTLVVGNNVHIAAADWKGKSPGAAFWDWGASD